MPLAVMEFGVAELYGEPVVDILGISRDWEWWEDVPRDWIEPDLTIQCDAIRYHQCRAGEFSLHTLFAISTVRYSSISALTFLAGVERSRPMPNSARHRLALCLQASCRHDGRIAFVS
jgi:hypothetical protein